ncbi:hypothetical protein D3C75_1166550 [compost metagenome]
MRNGTEFGGAHRSEVLRVRKENGPARAYPVVKIDGALVRVGVEVGNEVIDAQCHGSLLLRVRELQAWNSLARICLAVGV